MGPFKRRNRKNTIAFRIYKLATKVTSIIKGEIANLIKKEVEIKTKSLEEEIEMLKEELDHQNKINRRASLVIHNMGEKINKEKFINVTSDKMGVKLDIADFDLKTFGRSNANQSALIQFKCTETRNKVFYSKSKLKGSGISIHEDLTPIRCSVYKKAKEFFGVQEVWTSKGRIFISQEGEKQKITNHRDLTNLLKI